MRESRYPHTGSHCEWRRGEGRELGIQLGTKGKGKVGQEESAKIRVIRQHIHLCNDVGDLRPKEADHGVELLQGINLKLLLILIQQRDDATWRGEGKKRGRVSKAECYRSGKQGDPKETYQPR